MGSAPNAMQRAGGSSMTWPRWPEEEEQVGVLPVWPRSPLGTQSCHLLRTGVEEGDGLDSCAREGGKLSVRSRYQPKYKPPLGWRLPPERRVRQAGPAAGTPHPGSCWLRSRSAAPPRLPRPVSPGAAAACECPPAAAGSGEFPPRPSGRGSGDTSRRDRTAGDAGTSQE